MKVDVFRPARRSVAQVADIRRTVPDREASIRVLCDADNRRARRNRHNRQIKVRAFLLPLEVA